MKYTNLSRLPLIFINFVSLRKVWARRLNRFHTHEHHYYYYGNNNHHAEKEEFALRIAKGTLTLHTRDVQHNGKKCTENLVFLTLALNHGNETGYVIPSSSLTTFFWQGTFYSMQTTAMCFTASHHFVSLTFLAYSYANLDPISQICISNAITHPSNIWVESLAWLKTHILFGNMWEKLI